MRSFFHEMLAKIAFLPFRSLDSSYTRADGSVLTGATGTGISIQKHVRASCKPGDRSLLLVALLNLFEYLVGDPDDIPPGGFSIVDSFNSNDGSSVRSFAPSFLPFACDLPCDVYAIWFEPLFQSVVVHT